MALKHVGRNICLDYEMIWKMLEKIWCKLLEEW